MNRKRPLPSIARIKFLLDYNRETGLFRWKHTRRGISAGNAGYFNPASGYWYIRVDGTLLRSHRLAWAWVRLYWPEDQIDHKDGNRANCRFANLRKAARLQNAANYGGNPRNTTGYTGVSLNTNRTKFRAEIRVNRKRIHIGYFDTAEDAAKARRDESLKRRGRFAPELRNG